MAITIDRRLFLKRSLAAGTLGAALGAGLLSPQSVLAAWPKEAFKAKNVPDALKALTGSDTSSPSGDIKIKAPDIAENGAVVPITVSTDMADIDSIAIIASFAS